MNLKIKNLLTLAAKSGNLVSGDGICINYLKKDAVRLVILAEDASENTKKKFEDKTSYRNVPIRYCGNKEQLGNTIGKSSRTIIAITDKGFAESILKHFN